MPLFTRCQLKLSVLGCRPWLVVRVGRDEVSAVPRPQLHLALAGHVIQHLQPVLDELAKGSGFVLASCCSQALSTDRAPMNSASISLRRLSS